MMTSHERTQSSSSLFLDHAVLVGAFAHDFRSHQKIAGYDLAVVAQVPRGSTRCNPVDGVLALDDAAKHGEMAVQLRAGGEAEKELAPGAVCLGLHHADRAAEVLPGRLRLALIADRVTGPAQAVVGRL